MTLNWFLDESVNPKSAFVLENISQYEVFVPPIWNLEVRNGLQIAERRSRITEDRLQERLQDLIKLPLTLTPTPISKTPSHWRERMGCHSTTATYLELALRRSMPLATFDAALDHAVSAEGLPALP